MKKLCLAGLVLALALPAAAQARSRGEIQAELDALTAHKQQLNLASNVAENKVAELRAQRMRKIAGVPYSRMQVGAGETPETNAALVEQSNSSGRDIYDVAIDQAQNQKSQIQRELLKVDQQIDRDKAELKTTN